MVMQSMVRVSLLFLICTVQLVDYSNAEKMNISVIAVTQHMTKYFTERQNEFEDHLNSQLSSSSAHVTLFNTDYDNGDWIISPLALREQEFFMTQHWIFICEDDTRFDLSKMVTYLSKYDASKDFLIGYGLHDDESTIIHHFAFTGGDVRRFKFPNRAFGYLLSAGAINKLIKFWNTHETKIDFRIDVDHEIAKLLQDEYSIEMTYDNDNFCTISKNPDLNVFGLDFSSEKTKKCLTWLQDSMRIPDCTATPSSESIFFAVKTCNQYIKERIPHIKKTWASDAGEEIGYFAEVEDKSVPTIKLDIKNQEHGHCAKFLEILKWFYENKKNISWLYVADDDTLVSVPRLRRFLACSDPSEPQIIGERYGYRSPSGGGYDYITGGGGTVLSSTAVEKIVLESYRGNLACHSPDSPDDMTLGMWVKELGIPLVHSPLFHQARPMDYPGMLINGVKSISFHKFWNCEPENVYQRWLLAPARRGEYNNFKKTQKSVFEESLSEAEKIQKEMEKQKTNKHFLRREEL